MLAGENRLKRKKDFNRVYRYGKSYANDILVIYVFANNLSPTRIGFSVSKKVGKAVLRNRIKRVLREMCRENLDQFPSGYDIIFIARQKIKGINQHLIEVKLLQLLEKAGKKSGAFK